MLCSAIQCLGIGANFLAGESNGRILVEIANFFRFGGSGLFQAARQQLGQMGVRLELGGFPDGEIDRRADGTLQVIGSAKGRVGFPGAAIGVDLPKRDVKLFDRGKIVFW